MGTLRNKMIDAMNLRRFSLRTHESYLGAVSALARYYKLPPDKIDAQQLQAYLLHLTVDRGLSWSTCNVAVSAFRFFYVEVLGRERTELPIPPRKKPTKLPEVLSRQELERLFACARSPRNLTVSCGFATSASSPIALRNKTSHSVESFLGLSHSQTESPRNLLAR
jgi:integrase/recombinase XerD